MLCLSAAQLLVLTASQLSLALTQIFCSTPELQSHCRSPRQFWQLLLTLLVVLSIFKEVYLHCRPPGRLAEVLHLCYRPHEQSCLCHQPSANPPEWFHTSVLSPRLPLSAAPTTGLSRATGLIWSHLDLQLPLIAFVLPCLPRLVPSLSLLKTPFVIFYFPMCPKPALRASVCKPGTVTEIDVI